MTHSRALNDHIHAVGDPQGTPPEQPTGGAASTPEMCPMCNAVVGHAVQAIVPALTNGETYTPVEGSPTAMAELYHCENCGEEWYAPGQIEKLEVALRAAGFVYRRDKNLTVAQKAWARWELARIEALGTLASSADERRAAQLQRQLDETQAAGEAAGTAPLSR